MKECRPVLCLVGMALALFITVIIFTSHARAERPPPARACVGIAVSPGRGPGQDDRVYRIFEDGTVEVNSGASWIRWGGR